MRHRYPRTQRPSREVQLPLPLASQGLASSGPFQSLEQSKAKRLQRLQGRLVKDQATLGQRGTVPGSYVTSREKNKKAQDQRKALTLLFLTDITDANENRWTSDDSALPPFLCFALAVSGEGCAYVGRGSA